MDYKYLALFVISIVIGLLLMIDLVFLSRHARNWGNMSGASKGAAVLMGFLSMWLLIVMGYLRESNRAPYTIYNDRPGSGGTDISHTHMIGTIFLIWALLLTLAITVYWFTSKVAAHRPQTNGRIRPLPGRKMNGGTTLSNTAPGNEPKKGWTRSSPLASSLAVSDGLLVLDQLHILESSPATHME